MPGLRSRAARAAPMAPAVSQAGRLAGLLVLCLRAGQTSPQAPAHLLSLLTLAGEEKRLSAPGFSPWSHCPQIK